MNDWAAGFIFGVAMGFAIGAVGFAISTIVRDSLPGRRERQIAAKQRATAPRYCPECGTGLIAFTQVRGFSMVTGLPDGPAGLKCPDEHLNFVWECFGHVEDRDKPLFWRWDRVDGPRSLRLRGGPAFLRLP